MNQRIEQEIDQTLRCLQPTEDVSVSPLFVDMVSHRAAGLRMRRMTASRSRMFYPVVIVLMVGLTLANLAVRRVVSVPETTQSVDQIAVLSQEYGIGQGVGVAF